MPVSDNNHCNQNHHHPHLSHLKNSSSTGGLVPSSKEQTGLVSSLSSSSSRSIVDSSCSFSSSVAVVGGVVGSGVGKGGGGNSDSVCSLTPIPNRCRDCFCKMFSCRVLILLLIVKCLILSFIIPAHLLPTTSSEYPPPDHPGNGISGGRSGESSDSHQIAAGDEDGFDNINMMDDQPLSISLKSEILNLVQPFDIPSQTVEHADSNTAPTPSSGADETGGEPAAEDSNDDDGAGAGDDGDDNKEEATPSASESSDHVTDNHSESNSEPASETGDDNDGETENQVEAAEASETESDSGTAASTSASSEASASEGNHVHAESCSAPKEITAANSDDSMKTVLEKIESLMDAVKNIDTSIDKVENLVQSTMIDERVYKCISAINNGNQTQAIKYWKQILRYLSTPQKQAAIMNQLIRDSYGGSQEHIVPVIQFIEQSGQYYGYYTLFKELPKYNHLYRNTAVFTLGQHVKKSCGRDSTLYKSLPGAVQTVFSGFFTLQNKHNKGYLYYAKECLARHYSNCLDVLTKRMDPYKMEGLAENSDEKRSLHWKLNATDETVTKFFILNQDSYYTYRLQDLSNSPRFRMEEVSSNAEVENAHFQLKLHTDNEILIQVRDSEDYLEEEDFKSNKSAVRLHSFHKADGLPDSPRMFWLVNPAASSSESDDPVNEPESCNTDLALVPSTNGNGSSK